MASSQFTSAQLAAAGIKQRAARKVGTDRMNGLEKAYAKDLELRRLAGEVRRYWFGSINLRLADGCHYRTDFVVEFSDGSIEIHETKGFLRDDARVKIKWVAREFPWPVYLVRKEDGGKFRFERVHADQDGRL